MWRWTALVFACVGGIHAALATDDPVRVAETLLFAQRTRPDTAQFEHAKSLAEAEVKRGPDNPRAWTLLAWTRMAEHHFGAAFEATKQAECLAPGDPRTLALMSDALVELGRYDEAVSVTQRLVDAAPGIPAWTRAAHLRFLHNDADGAIQLMAMAARAGRPRAETSAWIWLDLSRLYLDAHDPVAAGQAIAAAEAAYPGLPTAWSAKARLEAAQGNTRAALGLYRRALAAQPTAEDAVAAWRIARQLKEDGAAKHLAALLDGLARLDQGMSRRALAEYFADSGETDRALALARAELAARPDIYSHATLARALQRAGKSSEASGHALAALALNTPDPHLQADMRAILAPQSLAVAKGAQP